MYVCEECGVEEATLADCEGGAMCRPCATLEIGSPVVRKVVKFGGVIVGAFWEVA